jgi:GNAT superfamily N-acetyltransferase
VAAGYVISNLVGVDTVTILAIGGSIGSIASGFVAFKQLVRYRRRSRRSGMLRLASQDDVLAWGNSWHSGRKLLRRLIALEKRILGSTLNRQREGTTEQWAPVFMHNPDSYSLLVVNRNQIVGYWGFAVLPKEQFDRAKAGVLLDSEITKDKIVPLDCPDEYLLYFVLIAVEEKHRSKGGGMLIRAFLNRLEVLARERRIFFREICANAFTKDGRRLCENFGMNYLREHTDFGQVFHRSLAGEWPSTLKDEPVAHLYRRYFHNPLR